MGYGFVQYLDTYYFTEEKKRHWMYSYRQDVSYFNISTNSLIESWHRTLKKYFFRDQQHHYEDRVIYTLTRNIIAHFQHKTMVNTAGVGRMTTTVREEVMQTKLAQEYASNMRDSGYIGSFLKWIDDNTFGVKSFASPETLYNITIDTVKREIHSCTCDYFFQHRTKCRHIALTMMELPYVSLRTVAHMEPYPDFIPEASPPPSPMEPSPDSSTERNNIRMGELMSINRTAQTFSNQDQIDEQFDALLELFRAGTDEKSWKRRRQK
ncbi:hypothetical protein EDD21DRAFT_114721 [Dissophora ornata]|nr:hypothetical protein EDD21DRAFT_114721 [Dissophora ornata]